MGNTIIILLCGGNKPSQKADIKKSHHHGEGGQKTIETTKWDASEFLDSEEAIFAYRSDGGGRAC